MKKSPKKENYLSTEELLAMGHTFSEGNQPPKQEDMNPIDRVRNLQIENERLSVKPLFKTTKQEDCGVFKETGGHYFVGGSKICCEDKPKQEDWYEKLRPEIIDGQLTFFDDNVLGDYPKIYYLKDIIAKEREECKWEKEQRQKEQMAEDINKFLHKKEEREIREKLFEEAENVTMAKLFSAQDILEIINKLK